MDKNQKILGKYILLKMTQKYELLPDEIIYQPKMAAVDAPIDDWYAHKIKHDVIEIIQKLPFKTFGHYIKFLFTDYKVDKLYTRYFCSDSVTSHTISLLATYAAYTDNFMANE